MCYLPSKPQLKDPYKFGSLFAYPLARPPPHFQDLTYQVFVSIVPSLTCQSGTLVFIRQVYKRRGTCTSNVLGLTTVYVGIDPSQIATGCHRGRPLVGFPWSKPSTQTSMVSLFGMVPAGLEPSTGLLGLVGYLGVVNWSKG